uniref:Protein phosphatase 1 regulatory subunit 14D n=1 Tax=Coturnix japonica TaxID=93934 RepID=A0A8C2YD38_COTJA
MLLHQDISPPFPLISRAHGETQEPALVTLPTAPATVLWHHQCCLPSASTSGSCSEPGVAGRHEEVVRMKPGEESSHRRLGKLTIKYNRKDLQRWLDLEEWINARLQELYQYPVSSWGKPAPCLLGEWDERLCAGIEDFITELLSRLKGLRRITNPQKRLPHQ